MGVNPIESFSGVGVALEVGTGVRPAQADSSNPENRNTKTARLQVFVFMVVPQFIICPGKSAEDSDKARYRRKISRICSATGSECQAAAAKSRPGRHSAEQVNDFRRWPAIRSSVMAWH